MFCGSGTNLDAGAFLLNGFVSLSDSKIVDGLLIPLFSLGSWLHLAYIKAKQGVQHARETFQSLSPFRRSRALSDKQRGSLSDEQGADLQRL
jgi:hypothetical protein